MEEPAPQDRLTGDPRRNAALERYTLVTWLFDEVFRIPGTRWRFGLDAIIGLVPGAGDLVGALVGAYGVWIARRVGAPVPVLSRMLLNIALDALVGAVPILGDLFDFAFKAHVRNRVLLEKWLLQPTPTQRDSAWRMLALLLGVIAVLAGTIWVAVAAVRGLYQLVTG